MSYDGWIEFNGVELVNLSRTAQLAEVMGINSVYTRPEDAAWIQTALGAVDYDDVTTAPWYDAGYPASEEFAGLIPLGFPGLGDSTLTAATTEYINDGAASSRSRNASQSIVASVVIAASTDRGAEFGKRWLDGVLKGASRSNTCTGSRVEYFRYKSAESPHAHYRNVKTTRGASVTRKVFDDCYVLYFVTFTLSANDPYEYGEEIESFTNMGPDETPTGPGLIVYNHLTLAEEPCPEYDYTPIYDPTYPALVPPPAAPDFLPAGWPIEDGATYERFWATIHQSEPSTLSVVPIVKLRSVSEARGIRICIWPEGTQEDEPASCSPLFSCVVTYMPAGMDFYLDGEQKAAYVWDGTSAPVRRTDSLIYSPDARPVNWTSFPSGEGLLVTMDLFDGADDSDVTMALDFMSKSD